jgi:hypothetical protein
MGPYFYAVQRDPSTLNYGESTMRDKVVGLVAAVALLASVGIANAKGPVKLTDVQLDKVTAGASTSASVAATQELNTLLAVTSQTLTNLTALSNFQLGFFNAFSAFAIAP